jgi:hypothetical protein
MKYTSPGAQREFQHQLRPLGNLLESIENRELGLAHRASGRGLPRLDIGTDIARRNLPLSIGIDRHPVRRVRQIARLLFAAPVEDIAPIKAFEGFGTFLQHHVMDREGAGEPRYAAQLRVTQTRQPDQVAGVSVWRKLLLVAASARQRVLAAEVLDVAEPVAKDALRQPAPEMRADPPEDHADLVFRIILDR